MNIAGKSNGGAQVDETFTVFVKDYCPNCMPGKVEPKSSMKQIPSLREYALQYNKYINVYILKDFIKTLKSATFPIIKCCIWYLVRGNIVL